GALGLAFSMAGVHFFASAVEGINFPYWYRDRWTMDGRVFTFLAAVCLSTPFLFGLGPALYLSKTDVNEFLKEGGRGAGGGYRARRWTNALLVKQLALTMALLPGGSLMMRSFFALYRADSIVDTTHLLTTAITLPN